MKTNKLMLAIALAASCAVSVAHAERGQKHQRHSYTADTTRTYDNGKTYQRHTEQTASDTGFNRSSTVTGPDGRAANRNVAGNYDAANKTYTKDISGTRMNGGTYSAQHVTQKTDDGYNRNSTRTNAQGQTASKQVSADVDRESGTVTKNITSTGFDGETHSRTVVKTVSKNETGGAAQN